MRVDVCRNLGQLSAVCAIAVLSVSSAEALSVSRFGASQDSWGAYLGSASSLFDTSALLSSPGAASNSGALSGAATIQHADVQEPHWVLGPWGIPVLSMPPLPSAPPPAAAIAAPANDGCGRVVAAAAPVEAPPPPAPAGPPRWVLGPWGVPTLVNPPPSPVVSAPAASAPAASAPAASAPAAPAGPPLMAAAAAPSGAGHWTLGPWGVPTFVSDDPPSPPAAAPPAAAPVAASQPCPGVCAGTTPGTLGACDPNAGRSAQIPFPASVALVGSGLIGVAGLRWARRHRS
jgi:hypothetical protein